MMMMSKFRVLVISFFLAFATTFVHARDLEVPFPPDLIPAVVTDVNGNALRSGARYYIEVPFAPDVIPSVVSDTSHGSCPTGNIILSEFRYRLPISITPVKSNSTVILEDAHVTVRFNFGYLCLIHISLVWKLGEDDRVRTGGIEGLDRFKLTKYEGAEGGTNTYQLAACPVSMLWKCKPVGYVLEDAVSHLAIGGKPLPIAFVPVREPRIAYKLPSM